jgi:SRSO17 transposase
VDEYCELYADLFPEMRSFEAFKYLHIGMISDLKRKTLPAIAKAVGLNNEQSLHNLFFYRLTRQISRRLKTAFQRSKASSAQWKHAATQNWLKPLMKPLLK